jgi:hypothetical protein
MHIAIQRSAMVSACILALFGGLCSYAGTKNAPAKPLATSSLHRMDFRVEGASCVACLRKTGQELRESKGVLKADVSIYKPYWAIVIYDAKQTNLETMKTAIKNQHVRLVDIDDKAISAVPAIIIPRSVKPQAASTD